MILTSVGGVLRIRASAYLATVVRSDNQAVAADNAALPQMRTAYGAVRLTGTAVVLSAPPRAN